MSKTKPAPVTVKLQWKTRSRKHDSDISKRTIFDSTCGRYQIHEVTFKVSGMRRIWQAFGPIWAGHTRINGKIFEGRKREDAEAKANQHYQQFMESEAAQ